ncbi:hypothetical protein EDD15DRAFT_2200383 [Pisolithus albus]|nr:hypothetical protein EDD15DRAFT_2200383 [Pisolithus albus]
MAGPGQSVVHDPLHDLESLFYVLVGIYVLLDGPSKPKCDKELAQCFDKYFNTFEPSMLKTITIQSDITWRPFVLHHISEYFQPAVDLLTWLRDALIVPLFFDDHGNIHRRQPFTHDMFIANIIDTLSHLSPDAWVPVGQENNDNSDYSSSGMKVEDEPTQSGVAKEVIIPPLVSTDESGFSPPSLMPLPPMLHRPTPHQLAAGPGFYSLDSGLTLRDTAVEDLDRALPQKRWRSSSHAHRLVAPSQTPFFTVRGATALALYSNEERIIWGGILHRSNSNLSSTAMPPKRKHSSKAVANSQPTAADNAGDTVESLHAKRLRADQLFDSEPAPPTDLEPSGPQPRRSSRPGKGSGGQLQQLHNLEHIQTAEHLPLSTRNLDIATQGQAVNPMAPGYGDADNESQVPPWAPNPTADIQFQPTFMPSQPGQPFGFRAPRSTASSTSGTHSIKSHGSSLSSRSSSNVGPIAPAEHEVMWKNSSLLLKNGFLNSACLQQVILQMPLHVILASIPPMNSPLLVPSPKISMQLATWTPLLPPYDLWGYVELGPSSGSLRSYLVPTLCLAKDDLAINEASPSEDDRFAESVVCGKVGEDTMHASRLSEEHPQSVRSQSQDICISGPATTQRGAEDVVAQHHQHNRSPHLPDGVQLMAVRDQQMSKASRHISRSAVEGQTPSSTDVIPAPSHSFPAAKSATSGMTSDSNSDPSQLQFYSPSVRDIIEHAKQISHCDIAAVNSFPLCADFNHKACDYVVEAIAECRSKGLLIPDGWWPDYTTGITKLLWEDLGNWRSSLKKKARFFVHDRYEWDPQNHCDVNAGIARKLLERGDFLKDGVDENGHTNNLVHPALSALIIEFFYTGTNAMVNIFPEVFQNEVPHPAVALAAMAIKVALDEIVAEGKEVTFKRDIYADVYADVLGLMAKCDMAPVHHAKTKACRVQWAKVGRQTGMCWDTLDRFGTVLGQFGTVLGQFGTVLGQFGTVLGQFGTVLGQFGTVLG